MVLVNDFLSTRVGLTLLAITTGHKVHILLLCTVSSLMALLTVWSVSNGSQGRALPFNILPAVAAAPSARGVGAILSKMADYRDPLIHLLNRLVTVRSTDLHCISYTLPPLQSEAPGNPLPCGRVSCT